MAHINERVNVGVGVVAMRNDEEFLVLKRAEGKHGAGTWSLPGGKPDPGESPLDGAERELLEETAAMTSVSRLQPLQFWTYDRWPEHAIHHVTLYFIGDVSHPERVYNREPHKHDELRWVTWDSLPQPTFSGLDQLAVLLG